MPDTATSREKQKVTPRRPTNGSVRPREHLTEAEVEKLIKAASKCGRHPYRDSTLILVAFTHGFRPREIANLKWSQVDLDAGLLHVSRLKNGIATTHPLRGREIRALRKLKRDYGGRFVFVTERGGPITVAGIQMVVRRAGEKAGFDFPVHPHMLRHACGYKLANEGRDTRAIQHYLGHRSIQHTVRYTELAADRFNGFWGD